MISVHTVWKCRRWDGGHLFSKPEAWKPLEAINTEWVIHKFLIRIRSWRADKETRRATRWPKESSNVWGVEAHRRSLKVSSLAGWGWVMSECALIGDGTFVVVFTCCRRAFGRRRGDKGREDWLLFRFIRVTWVVHPKIKMTFLLLPVVLFIPLDCFDASYWALDILAVRLSTFEKLNVSLKKSWPGYSK